MPHHLTEPNQSNGDQVNTAPTSRPAGAVSIRELEEREREHWVQMERDARRGHFLRIIAAAVAIAVAGGLFLSWRSLNSRAFIAEKNLKRIRVELDLQKTSILRAAPLDVENSTQDAATRAKLDDAFADLLSDDLNARVHATSIAQGILATRAARARARMRAEFPGLAPKYERELEMSREAIVDRKRNYNTAAADYNRTVKAFPFNLISRLFGFPDHLSSLA
jgi:hypothetical protein